MDGLTMNTIYQISNAYTNTWIDYLNNEGQFNTLNGDEKHENSLAMRSLWCRV